MSIVITGSFAFDYIMVFPDVSGNTSCLTRLTT